MIEDNIEYNDAACTVDTLSKIMSPSSHIKLNLRMMLFCAVLQKEEQQQNPVTSGKC